ncbi:amidase [Lentzea cavernae]|uniref:Amidase n=1 Tax=Lentzea cavernae TaxID=2020703 RepID=A0ABQ3MCA3_9PSEU|nr:amidase [Lentzea cavernae]GHH39343.1 amidase [Lentzea cavernae]
MNDPEWTVAGLGRALRSGALSSVEIVRRLLDGADARDEVLGVYLARFDDEAVAAAQAADAELAAGVDRGPLHGIPLGIKDLITTREGPTTAQSSVDHPWRGVRSDADVITSLRAAGAVVLGKVSTMEFGVGGPIGQLGFRTPRNPWNTDHWTGGSSSGTGSGVAAGFFPAGLGTDTAGSIRGPAAYCGVTGLKPTYGLVPVAGCVPLAPGYDTVGPMARTAEDCALVLDALTSGRRHADLTGMLSGVTVGVDALVGRGTTASPTTLEAFAAAVDVLRAAGAVVRQVEVPWFEELTTTTVLGYLAEGFVEHQEGLRREWGAYAPQTRTALLTGALISAEERARLEEVRRAGREAMSTLFREVDLVVTPTTAGAAPAITDLPSLRTIDALYTPVWNATGQPALSVPMGFSETGLPLGLQIVGRHHAEAAVLNAGHAFQTRTDWHLRAPVAPPEETVRSLLAAAGLSEMSAAEVRTAAARLPGLRDRIAKAYNAVSPPV